MSEITTHTFITAKNNYSKDDAIVLWDNNKITLNHLRYALGFGSLGFIGFLNRELLADQVLIVGASSCSYEELKLMKYLLEDDSK